MKYSQFQIHKIIIPLVLLLIILLNPIPACDTTLITLDQHHNNFFEQTHQPNYMIITSEALAQSVEFFTNWKEHIGFSVDVKTVSWISSQIDGYDTAEKVRNFLQLTYDEQPIDYVLFVGDDKIVPWRYCQIVPDSEPIPTDFYYADLTSDWDSDNDHVYAEFGEDDWPDFTAEVHVGRIPFTDSSIVRKICQKIITYEQQDDEWKKNALLIGAFSNFENEDNLGDPRTDNAFLMELLKNNIFQPNEYQSTTSYETSGLQKSDFACDVPLTSDHIDELLQNNNYGIITWGSHGSPMGSYRRYWKEDPNNNYVPDRGEIRSEYFITNQNNELLDDSKPSIIFSCSCNNADPNDSQNLGKRLLEHGAVAFIGATKESRYEVGWESEEDDGNMAITYHFFENFIENKQSIGEALDNALTDSWYNDSTPIFKNMLVFNLYGDPSLSLSIYPKQPTPLPPEKPVGETIIEPGESTYFTTTCSVKENSSVYYVWDFGDGTISDPQGPYMTNETISISHTYTIPGDYKVQVKVVSSFGDESNWSESLPIHIIGPVISVEEVSGGLFKLNAFLRNTGDSQAEQIYWEITIHNSSMFLGQESSGTIQSLGPDKKVRIISNTIFGLGFSSEIRIQTSIQNGGEETIHIPASILLFHIFIKEVR